MAEVYLKSDFSIKKISKYILLSLIPLILGGFYKNGISLYLNDFVGIVGMFKPLIITGLGFLIGVLVNLIFEYIIKNRKDTFTNTVFSSFHPVFGILIASVISINTNIMIFSIITFAILLFSKFFRSIRINIMALIALIIILIGSVFADVSFLNAYEASTTLHLGPLNYLLGMGSGGINTTYIIFLAISFAILAHQDFYKKSIPLFGIIAYCISITVYSLITNNLDSLMSNIFGFGILFSFVYLAPDSMSSSYTNKGQVVFGIILGVITFGLFLVYPPLAALGAIFLTSMMNVTIDKFCLR